MAVMATGSQESLSLEEEEEMRGIDELQQSIRRGGDGGEGGEDVTSFFKSVVQVTRAEQQLVSAHRESIDESEQLLAQEKMLLDDLSEADGCSVDEYAVALERVLFEKVALCKRVQAKLNALKKQLADEEALSARVKQVPIY